jgi:putative flippase GtrA
LRYAAAGIAVSAGYTVTVILLVDGLGWMEPALASALSFVIWTPVSYVVHRDFSFLYAGSQVSAVLRFLLAFIGRLAASAFTVHLATAVFGQRYIMGVLANWVVLPLVSYLILNFWVFRPTLPPASPQA